jgi:hypothetical protein
MDREDLLNEFDVAVDVLDGAGNVIQTWDFQKCEIIGYGTYLQDTTFIYQHSGVQDSEIRDRPIFHAQVFRFLLLNPSFSKFF